VRVCLARAIFAEPDVLLLDEPTNHLDLEAVLWLGDRLTNWGDDRTLVVVSHDRSFLDEVCTDVLHLAHRKLTAYAGDFSTFEAVREEQIARQRRLFEQQEGKKKEMQKFVDAHLHKGQSLSKDDAGARQAKKVAKDMGRIGAMGHDGKKWKLSYHGGAVCKLNSCWTHSLNATGFCKPFPLNINPGSKMCLSNATCTATPRRADGDGGARGGRAGVLLPFPRPGPPRARRRRAASRGVLRVPGSAILRLRPRCRWWWQSASDVPPPVPAHRPGRAAVPGGAQRRGQVHAHEAAARWGSAHVECSRPVA
jgi:hypothetical protein